MFDVDGEIWWRGGVGGEDSPISSQCFFLAFNNFVSFLLKNRWPIFQGKLPGSFLKNRWPIFQGKLPGSFLLLAYNPFMNHLLTAKILPLYTYKLRIVPLYQHK